MIGYDAYKTSDGGERLPSGGEDPGARCLECNRHMTATEAIAHYDQTGHTIIRRGIVQHFSFAPALTRQPDRRR